jgi:pyruvate kinase
VPTVAKGDLVREKGFVELTRTKIVATLGPALDPPGALERLVAAGVDVVRVNLSHGTPRDQATRVARARAANPTIAVVADLGGPKLRLGDLPGPVIIKSNETVIFGPRYLPVADPTFAQRVKKGDPVYLIDGAVRMEAVAVDGVNVECRVVVGGTLLSRKGSTCPTISRTCPR